MGKPKIIINELDAERLDNLLSQVNFSDNPIAAALNEEINRADILSPERMPSNVVSMNSKVRFLDLNSGEELTRTLVYPSSMVDNKQQISIMAPLGAALLGLQVNDEIVWRLPNGVESKIKVLELLYQPEAVGELHR